MMRILLMTACLIFVFPLQLRSAEKLDDLQVEMSLKLDKAKWAEGESILGKISLKLSWLPDSLNKGKKSLRFGNDQYASLTIGIDPLPTPYSFFRIAVDRPLENPVAIEKELEIPFRIYVPERFGDLINKRSKPFSPLPPGKYRFQARLDGVESRNQYGYAGVSRADALKNYVSEAVVGTVDAAPDEVVSQRELLALMGRFESELAGEIATYYASRGFDLSRLELFKVPPKEFVLDGHKEDPFLIRMAPMQNLRVATKRPKENHAISILNAQRSDIAMIEFNGEAAIRAPKENGVYAVYCAVHRKLWGFIVVLEERSDKNEK